MATLRFEARPLNEQAHAIAHSALCFGRDVSEIAQRILQCVEARDAACYYYWHHRAKLSISGKLIDRHEMRHETWLLEVDAETASVEPEWRFWAEAVYSRIGIICDAVATHADEAQLAARRADLEEFRKAHQNLKEVTGNDLFAITATPHLDSSADNLALIDPAVEDVIRRMLFQMREAVRCQIAERMEYDEYVRVMDELSRLAHCAHETSFRDFLRQTLPPRYIMLLGERFSDI